MHLPGSVRVPSRLRRRTRIEARLDEREQRITALFRRWPGLDNREVTELRRLWDERIRRARHRAP
jgi:hypothetical protein